MSHCVADNAELMKKYQELKYEMNRLNQDFELLYKIGGLIASLSKPYGVSHVVYSDVYSSLFSATDVIVFSGGSGLVNFRQGEELSALQQLISGVGTKLKLGGQCPKS